jgi:four helix bundle protein
MPLGSFRDLEVWQLSMDLVELVWKHTLTMPGQCFLLKQQLQGAAFSIPSNVAEGYRRKEGRAAYQNHVSIAMGSQGEFDTQFEIAFRTGVLDRRNCQPTVDINDRVGAMLNRLHDSLDR